MIRFGHLLPTVTTEKRRVTPALGRRHINSYRRIALLDAGRRPSRRPAVAAQRAPLPPATTGRPLPVSLAPHTPPVRARSTDRLSRARPCACSADSTRLRSGVTQPPGTFGWPPALRSRPARAALLWGQAAPSVQVCVWPRLCLRVSVAPASLAALLEHGPDVAQRALNLARQPVRVLPEHSQTSDISSSATDHCAGQ